ncbi:TPA: VRR-NUC domain-containing protein [archaeon]|nr:VRR-NUC domain-containing protein [Candidatus Undinarchaeales archaeon SRR5007147.bin71]
MRHQWVPFYFIPHSRNFSSKRGFAESNLRRRLEKQGWSVWKGLLIGAVRMQDDYSTATEKYELLSKFLEKHSAELLEKLQYYCSVHFGFPDFICYKNGEWKFVECKLGYEPLSETQKKCIMELQVLGFNVEVHKLVSSHTGTRSAMVNLKGSGKIVTRKQLTLNNRLFRKCQNI